MSIHDSKTRQLINLTIDKHWAANRGRLKLAEVQNEVRVGHPYHKWHPGDVHAACNAALVQAIKAEIHAPMSKHFAATNDVYIPQKYRASLATQPRGFYNRATREYVDSLMASPEDWDEGEDARLDLARQVIDAADPFRANARLLRAERAKNWMELLKRKATKEERDERRAE